MNRLTPDRYFLKCLRCFHCRYWMVSSLRDLAVHWLPYLGSRTPDARSAALKPDASSCPFIAGLSHRISPSNRVRKTEKPVRDWSKFLTLQGAGPVRGRNAARRSLGSTNPAQYACCARVLLAGLNPASHLLLRIQSIRHQSGWYNDLSTMRSLRTKTVPLSSWVAVQGV
jgi:hypothetical protein